LPRVGLSRGSDSYEAVRDALELIRDDVHIPADRPVLVKPNMVSDTNQLAATPVEAVRATLDFLVTLGVEKFIVGEGTAGPEGDTMGAFERFGYLPLQDSYDIEFRNLNENEWIPLEALGPGLEPVPIHIGRTYVDYYVVSVARMKTHLQAVVTLSLKNTAIASICNPERHSGAWHEPEPGKFSHDPKPINLNLARLIRAAKPAIGIVDGVVGMEGKGPVAGTPVSSGVALAGIDALAVDLVGAEVMGVNVDTVGYLWYLSQLEGLRREDVEVVGEDQNSCTTRYKMYERLPEILGWWVDDWKDYLEGEYEGRPA